MGTASKSNLLHNPMGCFVGQGGLVPLWKPRVSRRQVVGRASRAPRPYPATRGRALAQRGPDARPLPMMRPCRPPFPCSPRSSSSNGDHCPACHRPFLGEQMERAQASAKPWPERGPVLPCPGGGGGVAGGAGRGTRARRAWDGERPEPPPTTDASAGDFGVQKGARNGPETFT